LDFIANFEILGVFEVLVANLFANIIAQVAKVILSKDLIKGEIFKDIRA
jgi:hypothetical protein